MQPSPVGQQFLVMQFRPSLHQTLLSPWQLSCDQLYGVNGVNSDGILVVGVEMGAVMNAERLDIHADDE